MRISRKGVLRVIGLFALSTLIGASSGVSFTSDGRNLAACVQACSAISDSCKAQCDVDCAALFQVGSPDYEACKSACRTVCNAESKECKAKCNVRKFPPSPTEP